MDNGVSRDNEGEGEMESTDKYYIETRNWLDYDPNSFENTGGMTDTWSYNEIKADSVEEAYRLFTRHLEFQLLRGCRYRQDLFEISIYCPYYRDHKKCAPVFTKILFINN